MPPPRPLKAFLAAARAALTASADRRPRPLTIVVGNESADLDSLCSAVLLAYWRSHGPSHTLHIPLANLVRDDLRLRPELQLALTGSKDASSSAASTTPATLSDLITLSDLPPDLAAADTRWLLVDHNALTGDLARRFGPAVVGCIDHHVDEGVVPVDTGAPRIIETCGSCASLVVRAAADTWRDLAAAQPDPATDGQLARLALAAVLVDTSALQSASKTTDVDRAAVAVAEGFARAADGAYDRAAYFGALSRRKDDLAGLSWRDILRKDYKQWEEGGVATEKTTSTSSTASAASPSSTSPPPIHLGMATVVQGLEYLLAHVGGRAALLDGVRAFAADKQVDLVAAMTIKHDVPGEFARQLLLWAFSPAAAAAAQAFVAAQQQRLGLVPWDNGALDDTATPGEWRTCWWQQAVQYSRKQVAPSLRAAMREVADGREGRKA